MKNTYLLSLVVAFSLDISLGTASPEEFINFLYDFSKDNRLSIEWFGWYAMDTPSRWYERPENVEDRYKVTLYLLDLDIGYANFINGFEKGKVKGVINYGEEPKSEWVRIVKDLKQELQEKGYMNSGG